MATLNFPTSPFTMTTSLTTVTSLGSTYFDGTGDYLRLSAAPSLGMGTGDFTIEFWMYQTALSDYKQILDIVDGNSAGRLILWVDGGGILYNLGQNGSARNSTAGGAIKINTWNHVVLTRASGTTKFYINGVQSGSNYTDSTNYTCTTGSVYIGVNSDGSTYPYVGYLSDWRMVKGTALYTANFLPPQTPLTPVTNTQLLTCQYNGGATNNGSVDQSSFNNIITRAGTAKLTFPSGSFTAGSWIYFAIVRSGSGANNLKAYVNGVSVASATSTYNYSATTSTYIGSNPNTANQDFNGYIKDLRLTKGVARYTTTFTPPTTPDQTK